MSQPNVGRHSPLTLLGSVAVGGTTCFLVAIAAMHVLSPGIDVVNRPTSEYATGPYGFVMTAAFVSLSVATWSLVFGLNRTLHPRGAQCAGLLLLGWFGAALLVAAAFPIDPEGAPGTLQGTIHGINGPLAFLSLTLGTNLTSRLFKRSAEWRPIHRITSVLALVMIPEFIAGGVTAARGAGAGIAQRIMILTFVSWYVITGVHLRSRSQ